MDTEHIFLICYYATNTIITIKRQVKLMTKDTIKLLIDLVPDKDIDALYKEILRFMPKLPSKADELLLMISSENECTDDETVSYNNIS